MRALLCSTAVAARRPAESWRVCFADSHAVAGLQFTGIPTNLDRFDDPADPAHTALDLTAELAASLGEQHPECIHALADVTPLLLWGTAAAEQTGESYCLTIAEEACGALALQASIDANAGINGVLFDRWDAHCWALHGLRGIQTGNRTQVGGATQERLAAEHSPLNRAIITDMQFRTAQFSQFGTHCVGGWYGTCTSCFADLTFVVEQPPDADGAECPWFPGLTKPWLCAEDCDGYWTETQQLSCPAGATGKHPAVRKTYVLTQESCCSESFCAEPTGTEFLGLDQPLAYGVDEEMEANQVTAESCEAAGEVFFQGVCGARSSDWVLAHDGQPDPEVNCPVNGATIDSDCMLCPGSVPVACTTCGGNNDPRDNIVQDDGSGCEEYFPFPSIPLSDPETRTATGALSALC